MRAELGENVLKIIERRLKGLAVLCVGEAEELMALDKMDDLGVVNWLKDIAAKEPNRLTPEVREFLDEWNSGKGYTELASRIVLQGLENIRKQNLAPPPEEPRREPPSPRQSETFVDILDDMGDGLRKNGQYQRYLTGPQLDPIMQGITQSLISNRKNFKANILNATIEIRGDQGFFEGAVKVDSPVSATIDVRCEMKNDPKNPDRIQTTGLEVRENANLMAKAALKAFNAKGKVEQELSDPNKAFGNVLAYQLNHRGVRLTDLQLQFRANELHIRLKGEPLQRT